MNNMEKKQARFSDYLYVLYKWKKFLIINMLIVIIGATIYSFTIPEQFKSTATVMIPPETNMGLGSLGGILSGSRSTMNLGSKLFGGGTTNEDVLLGILNSRSTLVNVIKKYDLARYYKVEDGNMDKVLRAFSGDISFSPNEYGMVEVTVINKKPKQSAAIANYFVEILDSINKAINIEQAKNNRLFLEQRYLKNLADLKHAEDSLYIVQKKYGVFAVPEQLEVAVKAAGEYEAQLTEKDLQAYFTKQVYGENSPQYAGLKAQIDILKSKINELKRADVLSSESNVLFPFKEIPAMAMSYLRTYREVEIQSKILEFVLPMYEQAKVEEQKSMPTVIMLDAAVPPQLKDSPKKAMIILGISFAAFFLFLVIIFVGEKAYYKESYNNPFEEKQKNFYRSLARIYRLKLN